MAVAERVIVAAVVGLTLVGVVVTTLGSYRRGTGPMPAARDVVVTGVHQRTEQLGAVPAVSESFALNITVKTSCGPAR